MTKNSSYGKFPFCKLTVDVHSFICYVSRKYVIEDTSLKPDQIHSS